MPIQGNKEPPYYVQNHATKEAYMWYTGPCINGVRIHIYVTVSSIAWIDRFHAYLHPQRPSIYSDQDRDICLSSDTPYKSKLDHHTS